MWTASLGLFWILQRTVKISVRIREWWLSFLQEKCTLKYFHCYSFSWRNGLIYLCSTWTTLDIALLYSDKTCKPQWDLSTLLTPPQQTQELEVLSCTVSQANAIRLKTVIKNASTLVLKVCFLMLRVWLSAEWIVKHRISK